MRPLHRSPAEMLLIALLAVALFAAFFNLAMLDPHHIGWLLRGSDNGENALGLHAWLNDPQARGFRTMLLNAPDGVTLLFTDSNPLLGLIVRPFARGEMQFVGAWILICLALHLVFARLILAPYARSWLTLWCGVLLLTLLPTLYVRQIHANLCAHWLILWALWVFADARRAGDARWWLAVLGVAAAMHNYLLVMVAAIWASAMLERFVMLRGRQRIGLILGAVAVLGLVIGILSLLVDRGGIVSSGIYGRFGMPVDAPWNPALKGLSPFLPAFEQAPDRQMEAFQYLGAGILLLIVAAPLILWRGPASPAIATLHRRLVWLVPALIVLTLLAISSRVDFAGQTILRVPMSQTALALVDPIRASSRLFWPVAYALALFGITAAYRLSARGTRLLLLAALAAQVIDMIGVSAMTRHDAAIAADPARWHRTRDPRWAVAVARASDVTFMPPDATEQLDLFQEVAWRAVDAGKPVRLVYAARESRATEQRLARERQDFEAGRLAPDRLYVLLPQAEVPATAAHRLATLDGVRVVLPESAIRR